LRGTVKGLGGGSAPVDDERFVVVVAHTEASDVADFTVGEVESPKHEALVFGVEHRHPTSGLVGERVALEQRGAVFFPHEVSTVADENFLPLPRQFLRARRGDIQIGVHRIDVRLLDRDLVL